MTRHAKSRDTSWEGGGEWKGAERGPMGIETFVKPGRRRKQSAAAHCAATWRWWPVKCAIRRHCGRRHFCPLISSPGPTALGDRLPRATLCCAARSSTELKTLADVFFSRSDDQSKSSFRLTVICGWPMSITGTQYQIFWLNIKILHPFLILAFWIDGSQTEREWRRHLGPFLKNCSCRRSANSFMRLTDWSVN